MSDATTAPAPPPATGTGRAAVVLVVDDSRTMRGMMKMQLLPDAYEFLEAETAERAFTLARLMRPAAAVVDLHLPGMDGLDLVTRLRAEANPTVNQLGVVLVTGDDLELHRSRAGAVGVELLLRKPLAPGKLRDAVAKLVGQRSA